MNKLVQCPGCQGFGCDRCQELGLVDSSLPRWRFLSRAKHEFRFQATPSGYRIFAKNRELGQIIKRKNHPSGYLWFVGDKEFVNIFHGARYLYTLTERENLAPPQKSQPAINIENWYQPVAVWQNGVENWQLCCVERFSKAKRIALDIGGIVMPIGEKPQKQSKASRS